MLVEHCIEINGFNYFVLAKLLQVIPMYTKYYN